MSEKEKRAYRYEGLDISYEVIGEGKPLVVLHGWGSSSRVMRPVAILLSRLRTCYLIDLPGFGDSPEPPAAWSIGDYADMTESFIREVVAGPDQENGGGGVDMLVHSFGGRITLKLCARPFGKEYIDKVLITGGAGMKPKRSFSYYLKKYAATFMKAPFRLLPAPAREKGLAWLRSTSAWKALGSSEYSELSGVMRETFVKSVTEHLEPCLPKIPHEVLLVWGRDDEATPLYQAERMEAGIEGAALVVIDQAGHYSFLDRPKHFASIAEAFLKG